MPRRHFRTPAVAVSLALGLLLSGCGDDEPAMQRILDTERVERAIERSVDEQRSVEVDVSCPSGVPQKANWEFTCTATDRKGKTTPFAVKETDGDGHVHYEAR